MHLTSSIHRDELFQITDRWLRGILEPNDALRLTEILICDGFVIGETLETVSNLLFKKTCGKPFHRKVIHMKGELRDAMCRGSRPLTPRIEELFGRYQSNPDFYYREAPINGVVYLDDNNDIVGLYRVKRLRRIAEKANRRIANWIYGMVRAKAQEMAETRAKESGVPLERLYTPEDVMIEEFIEAEESVAMAIRNGDISLDMKAMAINDVGGIKVVIDPERLPELERVLIAHPLVRIVSKKSYDGKYKAIRWIVEAPWDREHVRRRFRESNGWRRYLQRGISEEKLREGLEPLLEGAHPTLCLELMFSNFENFVESEMGDSIHEERIIAQRENKEYRGYIPINVEFLVQYLFEVAFCPLVRIERLPIKLWGRYLPDTLISQIRSLYNLPRRELY